MDGRLLDRGRIVALAAIDIVFLHATQFTSYAMAGRTAATPFITETQWTSS
jgi:hypothetical protein